MTAATVIRGRWKALVATVAVCIGVAAIVAAMTPSSYSSTAQLLVSPISSADTDFVGVTVLRDSTISPTTDVLTVARLVKAPGTLARVARAYPSGSTAALADKVSVSPLSETSIVAVTATGSSPSSAARLADVFAQATVAQQAATFQSSLRSTVSLLQARESALSSAATAEKDALQARIASLAPLVGTGDPTLQVLTPAVAPTAPSSPSHTLVLGAALLAGIVLGILAAFLREATDDRVRRLDQALVEAPMPRLAAASVTMSPTLHSIAPAPLRALAARLLAAHRGEDGVSIAVVGGGEDGSVRSAAAAAIARALGAPRPASGLSEARAHARVVVRDYPAPTFDPGSISAASAADAVVVVAQAGSTRKEDLRSEVEILAGADAAPSALVLVQQRRERLQQARALGIGIANLLERLVVGRVGERRRPEHASPAPPLPDLTEQLTPTSALVGTDGDAA